VTTPSRLPAGRSVARRVLGLLLLMVALYYAVWGGEYSVFDLRRLHSQQAAEAARIEAARLQVDSLRALAAALENDPAAIEAVARERFGMIRPGEVIYRFVAVDTVTTESALDRSSRAAP
jgi:cell division protein FtsB